MTKTVVITGGVSGMGLSATKLFLSHGWQVAMADYNADLGAKVYQELSQQYSSKQVIFVPTNVAELDSVMTLKDAVLKQFGHVDSMINNAGVFTPGRLDEVEEAAWDRVMAIDVKSILLTAKAFIPGMMAQKQGTIVNTASVSGLMGDYNMAAYSAAKGAVANLVKSMALDYAPYQIRVNNVAPGPTNTPMFQANPQAVIDEFIQASPLKRLVEPADVARAMYFLATDASDPITGQTLPVTAGFGLYSGQPVQ
ncbi:short-chain dehydrogenase [Lactobacillus koreensis] [Lactiplantibacillus mudanjiangensis]|uniref:SDR family NAD(P)-dependent oxidoreductase n=1 Tax=Lactiplantibacillus mudanjiangensis TaxID=1296538 RepID=UPI001015ACE0|nr:SDR family oxidoreductase [Lactiplantibacillus mudanjiangensis]VDG19519.1 short-chain dehydrogenase [Lactobacillus koreensis] [Lactiplantibacillus mudanjiangensis]VDG30969.1 short-chain dehydrogenase [Lactobacillus koreensis] [Lactiplantibacillus mudanjiangensis]